LPFLALDDLLGLAVEEVVTPKLLLEDSLVNAELLGVDAGKGVNTKTHDKTKVLMLSEDDDRPSKVTLDIELTLFKLLIRTWYQTNR